MIDLLRRISIDNKLRLLSLVVDANRKLTIF